ncbi:MAG: AsmA-like C-terminal domain-containing protein [Candidatus Omnitrophica bacterium]|nr:AsmA-like C-terminal domain-containing protein [Candidatus Omnitrophota bacterium]
MKKIFIITASVLILLLIAAGLFIVTFDANRYKGALIIKLEESMGKDVAIDNISLSFLHGLEVKARGIAIKDKGKIWDNALLKAESLEASVRILPLLRKYIQIERLLIPELRINPGDSPSFRCGLDLNMRISINSLSQDDMLKTLSAKGNAKLQNAVLDNMNVLKAALDKLNMLPGLVQKLKDNMPEKYRDLLDQNYTAFKPINADFEIKDGRIFFDELLVESSAFYLTGKGSIGIEQDIDISVDLFIQKDLSNALINTAPELRYIADDKGLIKMPMEISGKVPDIMVMPDLEYVIQKLFVSKGQELLNRLLKGK